jgi:hypothetical protein
MEGSGRIESTRDRPRPIGSRHGAGSGLCGARFGSIRTCSGVGTIRARPHRRLPGRTSSRPLRLGGPAPSRVPKRLVCGVDLRHRPRSAPGRLGPVAGDIGVVRPGEPAPRCLDRGRTSPGVDPEHVKRIASMHAASLRERRSRSGELPCPAATTCGCGRGTWATGRVARRRLTVRAHCRQLRR